eukprot:1685249-Rhodomonas_salina.1
MEMADPHLVVDHVQRPDAQEQVGIHALSSAPTSIHSLLGQRVGAEPGVAPFLSLFLQFSSHSPAGLPQEFTSQQPISHRECDRRVLCTSCTHRRQRLLLGRGHRVAIPNGSTGYRIASPYTSTGHRLASVDVSIGHRIASALAHSAVTCTLPASCWSIACSQHTLCQYRTSQRTESNLVLANESDEVGAAKPLVAIPRAREAQDHLCPMSRRE